MKAELFNKNCIYILDELIEKNIKVDAIITDPPYELNNHGGTKGSALTKRATNIRDKVNFTASGYNYDEVFTRFLKVLKKPNIILFCSNQQLGKIINWFEKRNLVVTTLVWHKTNPPPLCNGRYVNDIEFILFIRGKHAPWNYKASFEYKFKNKTYSVVSSKKRKHPTQKPLSLVSELVAVHSLAGQTVLDPFMGIGTTGIACKNLNRNFIGIELLKDYYDLAKDNILGEFNGDCSGNKDHE